MNIENPNFGEVSAAESEEEKRKQEKIALVIELSESREVFPFPGMNEENYLNRKSQDQDYPEYGTPIDELLERFKNEGMRVASGKFPESGNIFILPAESDDIENDSLSPNQLNISEDMPEEIKKLIS